MSSGCTERWLEISIVAWTICCRGVDRRYLQWRADDGHRSLTHVSVPDKPIRERGRFGCANTPVRDADWLVDHSVGPILVGEIRISYIRDPADRGQSPDAAPSTGLLLFYTIRCLRHYRAAEYSTCWTFCDTVWNSLRIEGFFLRRGAFQACQAMDGAVLVHNCSSVTFHDELCIPWDAPRVVIDESSTITFGSVPRPHRVVLLGRDEDVNDRQNLADGDSRVVQFRRPELHSANKEYGDVALRDNGESQGAADLGVHDRHFGWETDAGNRSTVTKIHGLRGGDCRGWSDAGLLAGIAGTGVGREPCWPAMVQFVKAGAQARRATRSTIDRCVWRDMCILTWSTPYRHWFPSDAGVFCMTDEYCSVEETSLLSDYIDIIIR